MCDLFALNHKLLPCPMCGGKTHLSWYYDGDKETVVAECENIDCLMAVAGSKTPEEAIRRWNTRIEATELKVCPFCGSGAELIRYECEDYGDPDMYEVRCRNSRCQAHTVTSSNVEDVIRLWNCRIN